MTCVTYWVAVPHVVWKVRATLIVDWLLLDTLVTASPPQKKKKKKTSRDCPCIQGQRNPSELRCSEAIRTGESAVRTGETEERTVSVGKTRLSDGKGFVGGRLCRHVVPLCLPRRWRRARL